MVALDNDEDEIVSSNLKQSQQSQPHLMPTSPNNSGSPRVMFPNHSSHSNKKSSPEGRLADGSAYSERRNEVTNPSVMGRDNFSDQSLEEDKFCANAVPVLWKSTGSMTMTTTAGRSSPNVLPKNPRDTANVSGMASPKRRIKGSGGGGVSVNTAGSSITNTPNSGTETGVTSERKQSNLQHTPISSFHSRSLSDKVSSEIANVKSVSVCGGSLIGNRESSNNREVMRSGHQVGLPTTPGTPNNTNTSMLNITTPVLQSQSTAISTPGSVASQSIYGVQTQNCRDSVLMHVQLDDDEQFMFEQRLTQDDLGVAIKKINHSGKSQLRYVKCVPLRPPSSSEFGSYENAGPGKNTNIGNNISVPYYFDKTRALSSGHDRADVSVSSQSTSSSRFLERIKSGVMDNVSKHIHVSDRLKTVAGRVTGTQPNHAGSVGDSYNANPHHSLLTSIISEESNNLLLHSPHREEENQKNLRALSWGKKNSVTIPISHFLCVRKGKTTERTLRNTCPSSRLLSIITKDAWHSSLDIEAPTRLDRDKFAIAFSTFLAIPLEEEPVGNEMLAVGKKLKTPSITRSGKKKPSAALSEPGLPSTSHSTPKSGNRSLAVPSTGDSILPALTPSSDKASTTDNELAFFNDSKKTIGVTNATPLNAVGDLAAMTPGISSYAGDAISESARKRILSIDTGKSESMLEPQDKRSDAQAGPVTDGVKNHSVDDAASHVSSLTGGVDQEIVEELHQAIIELRAELDASRAEAARAVKVAEQAIQSAENCSSSDWNSTVTHKAAEAAALAQKKSAEAIARARMAEERLSVERKSTAFWRKQAQAVEEEAGSLKTRAAAAEIKQVVMVEELASERRKAARMFASLKQEFVNGEERQAKELHDAQEKNRLLEVELDHIKHELLRKSMELKRFLDDQERKEKEKTKPYRLRHSFSNRRKRQGTNGPVELDVSEALSSGITSKNQAIMEKSLSLSRSIVALRNEFKLVQHATSEELCSLHTQSKDWANQAGRAVAASFAETVHLRQKLAAESAMRLKLLNELQDVRGTVRVYCRLKPCVGTASILTIPTRDILVLNKDNLQMRCSFDRVFSPNATQAEVFSELEEPLISSLDGFKVTLMAFGQYGSGKSHSILGDLSYDSCGIPSLQSYGILLQALQQLFIIAQHRTDRFKDSFKMTVLEVRNEKLFDLVSGTTSADIHGQMIVCEMRDKRDKRRSFENSESAGNKGKLEIRTNIDGNTIVHGLVAVTINSFDDACTLWHEILTKRVERLKKSGSDMNKFEKGTNIITSIQITSVNIATGVGTEGKLQFVDMASADVALSIKKDAQDHNFMHNEDNTHFLNKSIDTLNHVVNARCQFDRSVPYRNSTLTHLLRDSLEADAKVLLLCCVSCDGADLSNTVGTLQFGTKIQKMSIGKATKHIVGSKD